MKVAIFYFENFLGYVCYIVMLCMYLEFFLVVIYLENCSCDVSVRFFGFRDLGVVCLFDLVG